MGWLRKLVDVLDPLQETQTQTGTPNSPQQAARSDAKNRLKLVLMHDRTQLDHGTLEKMRDELVDVVSRYVEIDKTALELNLESESNTIALVANIPVLRNRPGIEAPASGASDDNSAAKSAPSAKSKAAPETPTEKTDEPTTDKAAATPTANRP